MQTFIGGIQLFKMTQWIIQYVRENINLAIDIETQDGLVEIEVSLSFLTVLV